MRFPRQARIFRGQLDVAPVAGVVFLLLIFMRLGSLLYTPGVLVHLNNPAATMTVEKDGSIHFGTNYFTEEQTNLLRAALQNSPAGPPFDLRVNSNTPPNVAARVSEVVHNMFAVHPPAARGNVIGTDNPTVMVAVNFLGQYSYDNEIVGEQELKSRLQKDRLQAARESKDLVLTIAADERVNWNAVTRLARLAKEAGINETIWAEWMDKPVATPDKPVP